MYSCVFLNNSVKRYFVRTKEDDQEETALKEELKQIDISLKKLKKTVLNAFLFVLRFSCLWLISEQAIFQCANCNTIQRQGTITSAQFGGWQNHRRWNTYPRFCCRRRCGPWTSCTSITPPPSHWFDSFVKNSNPKNGAQRWSMRHTREHICSAITDDMFTDSVLKGAQRSRQSCSHESSVWYVWSGDVDWKLLLGNLIFLCDGIPLQVRRNSVLLLSLQTAIGKKEKEISNLRCLVPTPTKSNNCFAIFLHLASPQKYS